jgi:hypothetical protein
MIRAFALVAAGRFFFDPAAFVLFYVTLPWLARLEPIVLLLLGRATVSFRLAGQTRRPLAREQMW